LSAEDTITDLKTLNAPWNKTVSVQDIAYAGGFRMLRLRIKEGKRFTDLELDPRTLTDLTRLISDWLADNPAGETRP